MSPSDHKITKDLSEIYSNSLVSEICRLKKWLIMCPCWVIFWHKRKQQNTKLQSCPHNITLWTTLCFSIGPQIWKKNLFLWKSFHGSQLFGGNGAVVRLFHHLRPLEENFEFEFLFFIFERGSLHHSVVINVGLAS